MHRSVDTERMALWLDRSADQLRQMREMNRGEMVVAIRENYSKLAFLIRVAQGSARLVGGRVRHAPHAQPHGVTA